jgi:hypothetical protein
MGDVQGGMQAAMQILFVLSDFDEVKQLVSTEICRHGLA